MKMLRTTLALLLTAVALGAQADADAAPDFTLKSTGGSNLRLSEHRGEVILLNFWASWCGPCRQEMPHLDAIQKKYEALGVNVIGVSVDKEPAKADQLLKDIPVSFSVLYDTDSQVSAAYNVAAMPTTVLIDRDGNMRYLHKGYKPGYEQQYEQQIKQLIRE